MAFEPFKLVSYVLFCHPDFQFVNMSKYLRALQTSWWLHSWNEICPSAVGAFTMIRSLLAVRLPAIKAFQWSMKLVWRQQSMYWDALTGFVCFVQNVGPCEPYLNTTYCTINRINADGSGLETYASGGEGFQVLQQGAWAALRRMHMSDQVCTAMVDAHSPSCACWHSNKSLHTNPIHGNEH